MPSRSPAAQHNVIDCMHVTLPVHRHTHSKIVCKVILQSLSWRSMISRDIIVHVLLLLDPDMYVQIVHKERLHNLVLFTNSTKSPRMMSASAGSNMECLRQQLPSHFEVH